MKGIFIFILLIGKLISPIYAQSVDILNKTNFISPKKEVAFEYIEPKTNLSALAFIGTIKATGEGKTASIPKLFFKLKDKAYELRANCFQVNSFVQGDATKKGVLILDVYYGSDSALNINFSNHIKNTIYIFCDDQEQDETYPFSINEIEKEIKTRSYYQHTIAKDRIAKVSQGRFLSTSFPLKWKKNKLATFFSLSNYGLPPDKRSPDYMNSVFNTQTLNVVESDLGYLLVSLLKRSD
jgi:hypothetical protein